MRLRPAQLRPEGVVQLVLALRVAPRLLLLTGLIMNVVFLALL